MICSLTYNDIKVLKKQCSMGYLISTILFLIGTFFGITIYEIYFDSIPKTINKEMAAVIGSGALLFATIVFFGLNWKYLTDIRNNEKIQVIKVLQDKSHTIEYFRTFETSKYSFLVEGVSIDVEKELFENCQPKDKLILNYGTKSKFLIKIEKA